MPVNYNAFYVDPQQYRQSAMNNFFQSKNFLANQKQRDIDNALTRERDDYTKKRNTEQDEIARKDRDIRLIGIQAGTILKALEPVDDEQGYQAFRSWMDQIGKTPLGESEFFQNLMKSSPPNYDEQKINEGRQFLSALTGGAKKGKLIERVVPLGGKTEYIYSDGTSEIKQHSAKPTAESSNKVQQRIDNYHKELARLPSVRDKIKKGDQLYQIGQMMASLSGNSLLKMDDNTSIDDAMKKIDMYEKWLGDRLYKLEGVRPDIEKKQQPKALKQTTKEQKLEYLRLANGDVEKAKELAKKDGYQ